MKLGVVSVKIKRSKTITPLLGTLVREKTSLSINMLVRVGEVCMRGAKSITKTLKV